MIRKHPNHKHTNDFHVSSCGRHDYLKLVILIIYYYFFLSFKFYTHLSLLSFSPKHYLKGYDIFLIFEYIFLTLMQLLEKKIWQLLVVIICIRKLSFIFQCALHVDVFKKLGYVCLRKRLISFKKFYKVTNPHSFSMIRCYLIFLWENKPFCFLINMHIYR